MKKIFSFIGLLLMTVMVNAQRAEVLSLDLENAVYPESAWFSSPFSQADHDGQTVPEGSTVFDFLVDDSGTSYWHSTWAGGAVDNGVHYLRIDLPEDFFQDPTYEQGWGFGFQRRSGVANDHLTKVSVWGIPADKVAAEGDTKKTWTKDELEYIAEFDCPYASNTEWKYSDAYTNKQYTSICIFEEATNYNNGVGRGYWHISELRFYGAIMTEVDARDAACQELQTILEPCLEEIGGTGFENKVGKSRGQYDEDYFEAYETAINAANDIVNGWLVEQDESITIEMINEAKATLEATRNDFHAHVIPASQLDVAEGKYMIVSALDFQGQITKTYTAEEAAAANEENLIQDGEGRMPGDEGYVPTYNEGYPVSEGDEYQTTGSVIKAIYANGDNAEWKTFEKKAPYLFEIKKQDFKTDATHKPFPGTTLTYSIKNMQDYRTFGDIVGSTQVKFIDAPDSVFAIDIVPNQTRTVEINGEDVVCQVINIRNAGKPADTGINKLHCNGHDSGRGTKGNVVGWSWDAGASQWYLYPVSDEEAEAWLNTQENKALRMITEMSAITTASVNEMIEIAKDFNTSLDEENKLITSVDQLSSPFTATNDGTGLPALIDGDASTFWHSAYSADATVGEVNTNPGTNYLQVKDIDSQYTTIAFSITRRSGAQNDHAGKISVWGYDDDDPAIAKNEGTLLAEVDLGFTQAGEVKVSPVINTQGKTILRFYNEESAPSNANRGYWHAAEFQLFPATQSYYYGSADKTQYAKRKAEADALVTALETWTASAWSSEMFAEGYIPDEGEATPDFNKLTTEYNALKAAYEAWMAVYADPTELRAAIEEAEKDVNMVVVGENPGEWSSENATYKTAVDAAKALDQSCMYKGQEATDAVTASIAEAKTATMGGANKVVAGKWYRIHFGTEATYDKFGWDKTGAKDWYNASDYHDIKSNDNPDGQYDTSKGEGDVQVYNKLFGKYLATGKNDYTYTEEPVSRYNSETEEEYEDSLAVYNVSLISDPAEMNINTNIIYTDAADKGGDAGLFRFIEAKTQGDSTLYYVQHKASGLYLSQKGNKFAIGVTPVLVYPEAMGYGACLITAFHISGEKIAPLHGERSTNTLVNWNATNIGSNSMLFIENTDATGEAGKLENLSLTMWPGEFTTYVFPSEVTFGEGVEIFNRAGFRADNTDANAPKNIVILNKATEKTVAAGTPVIVRTTDEYINESEGLEAYLAARAGEGTGEDNGTPCLNKAEIKQFTDEYYATNEKKISLTANLAKFVNKPQSTSSMLIGSMGTVTAKPENATSVLIYDGGTVAKGNGSTWSAYIAVPTESILTSAKAKWSWEIGIVEPTGLKGDANGDGKVNGDDITIVVEYIKNSGNQDVLSRIHLENADVTKDGKVNGDDITAIVEIIKG